MAIRIITGKPGSGKTFYAVKHLRDKYYHQKNGSWQKNKNVTIISNINNLALKHKSLMDILENEDLTIEQFFNVKFQERYTLGKKVVYFIDECQQYFHKRFYNKEVFYYFQTHRHFGHDIYLITQNIQLIPIQLKELAEIEIHALPRNISFFGEFKYTIKSNNESIDKEIMKKDKKVFRLYQSSRMKESEKIKNPLIKYVAAALIIFLLSGVLFYKTFISKAEANETYSIKNIKTILKNEPIKKETEIIPTEKIRIDLIPIRLDYVITKKKIWVIEPITKIIMPIEKLPYKFAIDRYGRRIEIIAMVRKDLVTDKKQTSTTKNHL